mmetsp:Transcript_25303/g.35452  ORF Transcript_25303/g.35452 Transcript_25303/m.35452 type:complete len:360 (+) Transcript_25303:57-1136(+)
MNQKTTQILLNTSVALLKFANKTQQKRGLSSFYDVRPKTKLQSYWEQIKVWTGAFVGATTVCGGLGYVIYSSKTSDANPRPIVSAFVHEKTQQALNEHFDYQGKNVALNPNEFQKFPLAKVIPLNHNTSIYRFALPEGKSLGLPTASCVVTKGPLDSNGKPIIRPYTPITPGQQTTYFDLLVKTYPQGNMSKFIQNLKVGETLEVKGPIKKIEYSPNMKKKIGMIAGGTGLTPMLQIIQEVLSNPVDKTELTLLFANVAEEDILLKHNLDDLAQKFPNFKVHYVLETPPKGWNQSVGYVTDEVIKQKLPSPGSETLIMVCGPPPMMKAISGEKAPDYTQGELSGALKRLGYSPQEVFKF